MRHGLIALLALVMLTGFGYGGRGRIGPSGDIDEYPYSGTLSITIDDGLEGTVIVDSILAVVNDEYGLTGTPWEMHASVFVNIWGVNGLRGYQGQDGNDAPDSTRALHIDQLATLYQGGRIEVGLHGGTATIMDPYATRAPTGPIAPWDANGIAADMGDAAPDSQATTYSITVDGVKALRDTIGIEPVSHVTNGHTANDIGLHYLARMGIRNVRAGARTLTNFTSFPKAVSQGNYTTDRGQQLQLNRLNLDPLTYWWWDYDATDTYFKYAWGPFFPVNRMWIPHLDNPATSNITTNVAAWKRMIAGLAESRQSAVVTWHDYWNQNPTTPPSQRVGGPDGIAEILRFAAGYCQNGLLNREAPKLQLLKLDETMEKMRSTQYLNGPINIVDNIRLLTDHNATDRPWGFPDALVDVWADSGWVFVDSTTASAAGDDTVGYFNSTGVFISDVDASNNWDPLVFVFPVKPNSRARLFASGSTNSLPVAACADSCAGAFDAYIKYTVTPMGFSYAFADSGGRSWIDGDFSSDNGFAAVGPTYTNDYGGTSDTTSAYSDPRLRGIFHCQDAWPFSQSGGDGALFGTWYYRKGAWASQADHNLKWRDFPFEFPVPADCYAVRVEMQPVGWTVSESDIFAIACIELQLTPW